MSQNHAGENRNGRSELRRAGDGVVDELLDQPLKGVSVVARVLDDDVRPVAVVQIEPGDGTPRAAVADPTGGSVGSTGTRKRAVAAVVEASPDVDRAAVGAPKWRCHWISRADPPAAIARNCAEDTVLGLTQLAFTPFGTQPNFLSLKAMALGCVRSQNCSEATRHKAG